MATSTTSRKRVKPKRTISLRIRPTADNPFGLIRITERYPDKVEMMDYFVRSIPTDFGTAFEVTKIDTSNGEMPVYHVNLELPDHDKAKHTCECRGHLRWGHKTRCRHVAGLLKIVTADGKLPVAD